MKLNSLTLAIVPAIAFTLAACSSGESEQAAADDAAVSEPALAAPAEPVDLASLSADTPPPSFAQCRACHDPSKDGKNGVGPHLWEVSGRQAGSLADFKYSDAMKNSGLSWDAATLDAYLKAPREVVPGTTMSFVGVRDDAARAEIVAWLQLLKN